MFLLHLNLHLVHLSFIIIERLYATVLKPLFPLFLFLLHFFLQDLQDISWWLTDGFQMGMFFSLFRIDPDLLCLFELFLLSFLPHLLNVVMDRESSFCELNLGSFSIVPSKFAHISANLVLVTKHMPFQCLNSISQLVNCRATTTRL